MTNTLRTYYDLTKPGIIYGNMVNAVGGFALASSWPLHFGVLLAMLLGLAGVIASGCVANNYFDRDIDAHMERTKHRALVQSHVSAKKALWFSAALFAFGTTVLYFLTNPLASGIAAAGWVLYVAVYTPLKRKTIFSTQLGALSGAVPPVVGYVALTNHLDTSALLLFIILFTWQMPHFFAIAIYRKDEYKNAGVPVWTVVKGVRSAQAHMIVYAVLFVGAVIALYVTGAAGLAYLLIMGSTALLWALYIATGFHVSDTDKWARKVFYYSLVVVLVLCLMLILHK
jgi:protoheme IX farnesyltransferase